MRHLWRSRWAVGFAWAKAGMREFVDAAVPESPDKRLLEVRARQAPFFPTQAAKGG